ncbi:beta-1,3-galactosyl-O-glycosyl-glycoprotein beta-1,6-N-acetylglucosaminyltransferase 4-like [Lytechinus variegatus]|uniref:beta-1,3-galactosyl-O-glycosyl-glycoprotein beta-1,6-N-acetylglucosaminyltransferase 4-like n=1 Tax=Lytechinus variegatus TaxID=7654 RepID=UPI001BB258CE|nr:beta-1,3-galactosyl-O-glycosyl-glycoprotein beta-1,6-N-acetylglucosaminyltransferase 4-like [Lytechinus variegatus]
MTFFRVTEVRHHKTRSLRSKRYWLYLWNHWPTITLIYSLVICILVTVRTHQRAIYDMPLHLEYPVDCSKILKGNPREIDLVWKLYEEVVEISANGLIPIPSDRDVAAYADNCDFFKEQRQYPRIAASREEEQYPLAFVIVVHRNAAQVEKLLRALYQPQNVYAIHPDAKSSPDFLKAIQKLASCFDNVFVCSTLEDVQYGRHSRLMADINCMRDLIKREVQWKYLINQCGEAFPLKTNLEMVRQLKSYNGLNDVESYPTVGKKLNRFHRYGSDRKLEVVTRLQQNPPPGDIELFSGNAYNSLTRGFVEYVLSEELPRRFLEWLEDAWSPDEHYWASLNRVPGTPGGFAGSTMDLTTYVNWKHDHRHVCNGWIIHHLCVFSSADLPVISSMPHLFVNKLYYFKDPIALQCLQDSLTNRTHKDHFWLPWLW